jgi:hypothetical protein
MEISEMNELPAFAVRWWFRNDHEWLKTFDSSSERDHFINRVGLVTHPDIVRVTIYEGEWSKDLKRVG